MQCSGIFDRRCRLSMFFALILSYYSKVSEYAKTVSDGEWCKAKNVYIF